MTRFANRLALSIAAAGWLAGSLVLAQGARGTLTGIITDHEGPVQAADVEATNKSTTTVYTTRSDARGRYTLSVPPGTYDVVVPPLGFRTERTEKADQTIEAGKTLSLDFALAGTNDEVIGDDAAFAAIRRKYADLKGPAPRLPNGKPDLSGMWSANVDPKPEPAAMLPWAQAVHKERQTTEFRDLPSGFCLPDDPSWSIPILYKIIQTPTLIVFLTEADPHYRQIFMDGRGHPKNLDPTYHGHSIGRWDGDTLVVDTVGFNDKTWLTIDGYPHTEQLHVVERFRRTDLARMTHDVTMTDPGTFTKPVVRRSVWELAPGEEIMETICAENNKYLENITSK